MQQLVHRGHLASTGYNRGDCFAKCFGEAHEIAERTYVPNELFRQPGFGLSDQTPPVSAPIVRQRLVWKYNLCTTAEPPSDSISVSPRYLSVQSKKVTPGKTEAERD